MRHFLRATALGEVENSSVGLLQSSESERENPESSFTGHKFSLTLPVAASESLPLDVEYGTDVLRGITLHNAHSALCT